MLRSRVVVLAALVTLALPGCAWMRRSSVSSAPENQQATAESHDPSVSGSGRYTAFSSNAPNLVGGDTNATSDVFVRDNIAETTERVSVATDGTQGNGSSTTPSISNDGRYVAFASSANNLATDGDAMSDVFVRDRVAQTTALVSVKDDESPITDPASTPVISGDGRTVAFQTLSPRGVLEPPPVFQAYGPIVRHLDQQSTRIMASATLSAIALVRQYDLSDDGTAIVYTQMSLTTSGSQSTVRIGDTTTGAVLKTFGVVAVNPSAADESAVAISGDGTRFAFVDNPLTHTDLAALIVASTADPTNPILSTTMPFASTVFLSQDGTVLGARLYSNGAFVASVMTSLGAPWTVVSATTDGLHPADTSGVVMSADGKWFAFGSSDSILVLHDTNGVADVFTRIAGNANTPPT